MMADLKPKIEDIINRTIRNNLWRQRQCFNLIPSESTPSLIVKMCEISDPAGRYAEHRVLKGREIYLYQGTGFIREVEEELRQALQEYFNCRRIELRPISGQMANEVVFKGLTRTLQVQNSNHQGRMQLVMNNDLTRGGHLSQQPMGALFNYVGKDPSTGREAVVNLPVKKENPYCIDAAAMGDLIRKRKPDLLILGKSMCISPEPVAEARAAVRESNLKTVIMYDMAHTLGLYGAFQNPLEEGADLITGSTHKTFFGSQRGVVVSNIEKGHPLEKLWTEIEGRAFPGSTSNHHLGTLLGLLIAAHEMNAFKESYQDQVIKNAKAFAKALKEHGLEVEGDPAQGYTSTHQVIVRVRKYGTGEEVAARLEDNHIICNYQALPDDNSFIESSGIRTGVQEMTRFGMSEDDFHILAGLMAEVVIRGKNIKAEASEYRKKFLEMKYCLPLKEAALLGARILESIFPSGEHIGRLAENLIKLSSEI
jgi:glycine/serine hydroxymethyltransferase